MGAGIPLPALHVEAPPQPDTLGNFSKLLAIKQQQAMAPLQQQQAQQQVQTGAIDLQQKQLQMKAQQTLQSIGPQHITRDSQGRPTGYDYDGLMNDATSKGIPPAMLAPIQEMHKKAVDTVLAQTNADKGRIENQLSVNKQAYEQMEGIKALTDPAQRQSAWEQFGQWAQKNGMDTSQAPPQAPDNDTLAAREAVLGMHGQALADAKELAQAKEAASRAHEADVNAQKTERDLQFGPTGPAAESKYRFILGKMRAGTALPDEVAYAKNFEASQSKTTTSSDSLGIKSVNTSGPAGTSMVGGGGKGGARTAGTPSMTPGNSLVDEIGQGKMAINRLDNILTRRPELAQAVAQKYPDFDSSKVKSYTDAYKSFTSGPDAKSVNAGAVALQHLWQLKQINDDNPIAVHNPASASYKAYHNLLDTVADELGTFYGEPKTNEVIQSKKDTLGGLLNRGAAITEQAKAMGIKMDEQEQKWQNAAPSKAYQAPMPGMSDKAKQARAALDPEYAQAHPEYAQKGGGAKGGGGGITVTDPRGVAHTFPNQAAADQFKKDAGIQ